MERLFLAMGDPNKMIMSHLKSSSIYCHLPSFYLVHFNPFKNVMLPLMTWHCFSLPYERWYWKPNRFCFSNIYTCHSELFTTWKEALSHFWHWKVLLLFAWPSLTLAAYINTISFWPTIAHSNADLPFDVLAVQRNIEQMDNGPFTAQQIEYYMAWKYFHSHNMAGQSMWRKILSNTIEIVELHKMVSYYGETEW